MATYNRDATLATLVNLLAFKTADIEQSRHFEFNSQKYKLIKNTTERNSCNALKNEQQQWSDAQRNVKINKLVYDWMMVKISDKYWNAFQQHYILENVYVK